MDMNGDQFEFVSLASLLDAGESVGVLAQAVEGVGVQGWDRYGRFRKFAKDDDECRCALNALAYVYSWQLSEEYGSPEVESPVEGALDSPQLNNPLLHGWMRQDLPDLKAIGAGLDLRKDVARQVFGQSGGVNKGQRMDLLLVGALYQFIKGNVSPEGHPDFENKQALAALLDNKFGGVAGKAGSLEKKLKEAEDALRDAEEGLD